MSQGILRVGGEAYPLHNIARVQNVELVPRRGRAVGSFVKQVLLWAVLAVGAVVGLRFADLPSSDVATYTEYVAIGVVALLLISLVGLLIALARRTYYALVVETSGIPHTAVISPDEAMVNGLVHQTVNNAPAQPQDALRELTEAVNALRGHISPADREVVDASMRAVGTGANAEPGGFRRALRDISGVASMVGQVGAPVIEAVRKVMAAFGLG